MAGVDKEVMDALTGSYIAAVTGRGIPGVVNCIRELNPISWLGILSYKGNTVIDFYVGRGVRGVLYRASNCLYITNTTRICNIHQSHTRTTTWNWQANQSILLPCSCVLPA